MNNEIKLVLCDMDGTILDSNKKIPKQFYEIFNALEAKGVAVGIASGRPLSNINIKFPKVANRISAIAENGGCVSYKGKIIYTESMSKEQADKVVLRARETKDCGAVLCSLNATYIEDDNEELVKHCTEYYPDLKKVDDLLKVEDRILKISIRDYVDTATNSGPAFEGVDEKLSLASSDKHWLDLMNLGLSKAKGIDVLCEHLNITTDQIMAFGDQMNDYEMLKKVKYSYAMDNALDEVKKICRDTCESNDNDGVMKTLKKVFHL